MPDLSVLCMATFSEPSRLSQSALIRLLAFDVSACACTCRESRKIQSQFLTKYLFICFITGRGVHLKLLLFHQLECQTAAEPQHTRACYLPVRISSTSCFLFIAKQAPLLAVARKDMRCNCWVSKAYDSQLCTFPRKGANN